MNAKTFVSWRLGKHHSQFVTAGVILLMLLPLGFQAGGVVTTCTEAALRAAMAGGGMVTFACDGTITLSNTITIGADTVLDGTGQEITLSGGGSVRALSNGPGLTLTLLSLTIADGMSSAGGGGGVYVAGLLNATNCTFRDNGAIWNGGAICNEGTVNVSCCAFLRNQAVGVNGAGGSSGTPIARPGVGGDGGPGCGGAIYNAGAALIDRSLFATNLAVGGTGGVGGEGILVVGTYSDQTGGRGGDGGAGQGGALFNVNTANVVNCTFAGNIVSGGAGGQGGNAGVFAWHPSGGTAIGFSGGDGGMGRDANFTIFDQPGSSLYLGNCTVAFNSAVGGAGGAGGSGSLGIGSGQTGPSGSGGSAGIAPGWLGWVGLVNTLLAGNVGGNGGGGLIDLGHNLSSDATCAFTNTSSLNSTDPRLGPLADNGGPTPSMALLLGSPAIDAGDTAAAPAVDQRGVPRPVGPAADIGAFEYGWPAALRISRSGETNLDLCAFGVAGQWCRLLASTGFSSWMPIATNQIGTNGTVMFNDVSAPGGTSRFYRLVVP